MCGRFKAGFEFREIKVRWQIFNDLDFAPNCNIAPTQTYPIIVERASIVEARPMRWAPLEPMRSFTSRPISKSWSK
jgi:putative SOS response-associated peptidase YedK